MRQVSLIVILGTIIINSETFRSGESFLASRAEAKRLIHLKVAIRKNREKNDLKRDS